jgi:transcriptional regulator with XRE-family HTH domain
MPDNFKHVGERIAYYREAINMSQKELADRLGIKPPSVSQIESGVTKSPAAITLLRAAKILGLDPMFLLTGENPKPQLREDVMRLVEELEKLSPDQVSRLRAMLLAFGPAADDEHVSKSYKSAPRDYEHLHVAQGKAEYGTRKKLKK